MEWMSSRCLLLQRLQYLNGNYCYYYCKIKSEYLIQRNLSVLGVNTIVNISSKSYRNQEEARFQRTRNERYEDDTKSVISKYKCIKKMLLLHTW